MSGPDACVVDPLLPDGPRAFCGCSGRLPPSAHHCESSLTLGLVTVRKPPQTPVQPACAAPFPSLHQASAHIRHQSNHRPPVFDNTPSPAPIRSERQETAVYDPLTTHHSPPNPLLARVSIFRKTNKQTKPNHPPKCLLVTSSSSKWLSTSTQASNQPSAIKASGSFFSVPSFSVFDSAHIRLRPYRISSDQTASP